MIFTCFAILFFSGFLRAPLETQESREPRESSTVIIVKNKDNPPYNNAAAGFLDALKESNIAFVSYEYNRADETTFREIESQKPGIVFTLGSSVTKSVSQTFKTVPIVFSMVVDPRGSGIKGENVAGVTLDIPVDTQFKYLKRVVPRVKTVGVIYNPDENEENIINVLKVAAALDLSVKAVPVKNIKDIPGIGSMGIDALWFIPDNTVCRPAVIKRLLLDSLKSGVPVMGISPSYARAGALLALSCEYRDIGKQAGEIAARVLKGETCSDIGIIAPRKEKLYLNQAVAHRLGIKIPGKIKKDAERIFGQ